jgi:D-alanyl-D-alanine carboxypeptidase
MAGSRRRTPSLLVTVAVSLAVALFGLVPSGAAHVDGPTVTAQHAFIGDPLFGLDTPGGSLYGILPDERTAMASTTKLMTLDVALHAVDDGVVGLDDDVTVDAFAASIEPSNSVMATVADPFCQFDANGIPVTNPPTAWSPGSACVTLEPGEVVSLETLFRGMMYPSGNDAAWAIAYYVANAYGDDVNSDGVVDGKDFVEDMNQHALDIGLTDTHFTSANGWDDPSTANPDPADLNHYTTARELAITIDHGLGAHDHFGEVIGFQGTYTDTSQGPNGSKTYSWGWGSSYPGWEGAKGGGTQNCNGPAGPNGYCVAQSARRIGRRVVVSCMQCVGGSLSTTMFDYGFAQIFHPDPRGSSASVGAALRHDTTCWSSSRCVSAVLPVSGDVKVVSWAPDVDGSSISVLDEETLPKSALPPKGGSGQGPAGDVAVTRLPLGGIVVANRKGSSVELSRWSMDGAGSITLLASGVKMGSATTMALQPVAGDMFLSAATNPDGVLVVKSWQLDGTTLVKRDTYEDNSRVYSEVAMAGPLTTDVFNGHRAVTAAIAPGVLVHDVWGVDEVTGEITRLGELAQPGTRDRVEISPFFVNTTFDGELFPPVYYATGFRSNGIGAIRFYRIDASGDPVNEAFIGSNTAADEIGVAPLGTGGVMSALRGPDGTVQLIAWDAHRNADDTISPSQISQHTAPDAGSLDLVEVDSIHADGDYATAVTDPIGGQLRLRLYRSGDRPY